MQIEKLEINKNHLEILIEGSLYMDVIYSTLESFSHLWGIKKFEALFHSSNGDGLGFGWISNNKYLGYYQPILDKDWISNNLFDQLFDEILQKVEAGEIIPSEHEIKSPNEMEWFKQVVPEYDFLEKIEKINQEWEIEEKKRIEELINKKFTNRRKPLGLGVRALLDKAKKDKIN